MQSTSQAVRNDKQQIVLEKIASPMQQDVSRPQEDHVYHHTSKKRLKTFARGLLLPYVMWVETDVPGRRKRRSGTTDAAELSGCEACTPDKPGKRKRRFARTCQIPQATIDAFTPSLASSGAHPTMFVYHTAVQSRHSSIQEVRVLFDVPGGRNSLWG